MLTHAMAKRKKTARMQTAWTPCPHQEEGTEEEIRVVHVVPPNSRVTKDSASAARESTTTNQELYSRVTVA